MHSKEVQFHLNEATDSLYMANLRQKRLEAEVAILNSKLGKLRALYKQGIQQLSTLKSFDIILLSEFSLIRRLTESAVLELEKANEELALNFLLSSKNLIEISTTKKEIERLRALLSITTNNILEFKK